MAHRHLLTCVLIALAVMLVSAPVAGATAPRLVRLGDVPRLPLGTIALGPADPTQVLRIAVALEPRDPAGLALAAARASDPTRPGYRAYLGPSAFAARYGAAPLAVDRLEATLRAAGLRPGRLSPNHLSFDIVAPAARLERALHVTLARVLLPDRRTAVVNLGAPALPAPAAGAGAVQAIIGLDGLERRHGSAAREPGRGRRSPNPKSAAVTTHAQARTPQACGAATSAAGAQGAYTADQIAGTYRFGGLYGTGDLGAGVTVGVYELEPDAPTDLAAYQACYGTATSITYVPVDGGVGSGAGMGEAAFDIEQLIGLAPKARLLVYQAPNSNLDTPGSGPYDLFATMIGQDRVSVITNSWGECEAVEGASSARAENTLFEEAALQGQSVLAASGDQGSEDCLQAGQVPNGSLAVDDPGSQPYVTDVGGSSLTALGPPPSESVWNSANGSLSVLGVPNGSGSGGGGISSFWPMPGYQLAAAPGLAVRNAFSSGTPCGVGAGLCREVPDVAASADPLHGYVIYYNGARTESGPSGWQATGGTSGAAPLWAAILALANADPACGGAQVGFANPALYRVAATSPADFNDVTSGNNDYTGGQRGRFPAGAGYDMASGLGTPNATGIADALCADVLHLGAPASVESFVAHAALVRLSVSARSDTPVLRAGGLPPGVRLDRSGERLVGTATRAGAYAVSIGAVTPSGQLRSIHLSWRVATLPSLTRLRLTGLSGSAPTLSVRLSAGRYEAAPASVRLTLPRGLRIRGAGAIVVTRAGTSRRVAHTGQVGGRTLALQVRGDGGNALTITVNRGGLLAAPSLRAAPPARLLIVATVTDAAGRSATLSAPVRPARSGL